MAEKNSDGSILLKVKLSGEHLTKDIASITKKASKSLAAIGVALTGIAVGVTKSAVSAFAEYEQLVGGVETLFKSASDTVVKNAEKAYKTAGVSANAYMQNVTSFSASLISSLNGDVEEAAQVADMALIDIADNANKMGSSIESITTAYQGFAKGQYMLLDNLKLGYGGTKTEMERLLKDAQKITKIEYDINNLADVYSAIHVIQGELGITGTTAKEAAKTISGSSAAMKASWENVLTAIGGGGDIDAAIENFANSVAIYFENIMPVVEVALNNVGVLIERTAPLLVDTVAQAFINAIPRLTQAVYRMMLSLYSALSQGIKSLLSGESKEVIIEENEAQEQTVTTQKKYNKELGKTEKQVKKILAGFDELNVISKETAKITENESALTAGVTELPEATTNTTSAGTSASTQDLPDITAELASIMAVASTALLAIGLILLFTGNIGWGIGFIIAGAVTYNVNERMMKDDAISQEVKDAISNALIIAGMVAIVLGVLLCMAGQWFTGIGLIAFGAFDLGKEIAVNWNSIKEKLYGSWFGLGLIIGGGVAIILGILLCLTPAIGLGIALIALGATAYVVTLAANWNGIVKLVKDFIFENPSLVALISGGLLIIGILVCFINLPLGIALIAAGAAGLVTVTALNRNSIVDWIKDAWQAVKDFWNEYIAPVFTLEWWKNLGITCMNGLIIGFEAAINGIINAFESLINSIVDGFNALSFDLPELMGGGHIGFNLQRVDWAGVSIPRLAKGAVIPANREFLAVLGDQRSGTNVEAPLATITEAMIDALSQTGGNSAQTIIIPVNLDGRELARIVRSSNEQMGNQTVYGGFADAY